MNYQNISLEGDDVFEYLTDLSKHLTDQYTDSDNVTNKIDDREISDRDILLDLQLANAIKAEKLYLEYLQKEKSREPEICISKNGFPSLDFLMDNIKKIYEDGEKLNSEGKKIERNNELLLKSYKLIQSFFKPILDGTKKYYYRYYSDKYPVLIDIKNIINSFCKNNREIKVNKSLKKAFDNKCKRKGTDNKTLYALFMSSLEESKDKTRFLNILNRKFCFAVYGNNKCLYRDILHYLPIMNELAVKCYRFEHKLIGDFDTKLEKIDTSSKYSIAEVLDREENYLELTRDSLILGPAIYFFFCKPVQLVSDVFTKKTNRWKSNEKIIAE